MNTKQIIMICFYVKWVTGQSLNNHIVADENGIYHIFWSVNVENITFEVQVATKGYLGFGFSPNGGMAGSDIVIGWVLPNGEAYFQDRHALGLYEPLIDSEQNYNLINAYENETHTVLRFTRKLNTCDKENDTAITDSATKIIYAWHPEDPGSITGLQNHGTDRRGAKSSLLLSPPLPPMEITDDITIWDIQMPNVTIPPETTSMWCLGAKLPPVTEPNYYIGYSLVPTPGNENLIHHVILNECPVNSKFNEEKYQKEKNGLQCTDDTVESTTCLTQMFSWTPGRQMWKYYPKGIGRQLGEEYGGPSYFTFQIHYTNFEKKQGIVDSTKVQVYLSKNVTNKTGTLSMNTGFDYTLLIPPQQPVFKVATYCPSECTSKALPEDGINVFRVYGHGHLAGRKFSLRHFRDNKELKPIFIDDNFDFYYQEIRELPEIVKVMPGDMLLGTCVYSSMDKNYTVIGGRGTYDEMCIINIFYYPIVDLQICQGGANYNDIIHYFGIDEVAPDKVRIIAPDLLQNQSMIDVIRNYDWTTVDDAKLQNMISIQYDGMMNIACVNNPAMKTMVARIPVAYPTDIPLYIPPKDECGISST